MKTITKTALLIYTICLVNFAFCQEVILIRHAKVDLDTKGWIGHKKAAQLSKAYNSAAIVSFDTDRILNELPDLKTDTIYVSNLIRSISTGWILFGDSATILSSPFLDEFDLHILRLPLILPYKAWTGISRAFWFLGTNKEHNESYREAEMRVKQIADFIEQRLNYNRQVVMITHGFLNRNIAKELQKRNWEKLQNNGKKNLGATILKK
ncbi:hypothetical protein GM418_10320 [Maribellus comscasis]|uniref:Histidine phosphatase family protein n=1 Tax=Maribellus comscasis TaxID=2681766 RepID=A0A6I6JV32_9BACT|nr:phosphoglycerate mutase family protein [Maribellus comscasis]QGY44037.1 hypothetical protein GM418_10320 [Maribellus comscasis]